MKKLKDLPEKNHGYLYGTVRLLSYWGYFFLLAVFYLLLSYFPIKLGFFWILFYAFFIVILPYAFIFAGIKNPFITGISNLSTVVLFWYSGRSCQFCGIVFIAGLLPALAIHNLFMSIGHYLYQRPAKDEQVSTNKTSFGTLVILLLVSFLLVSLCFSW